jgi:hypothetical protein
MDWIIVDGSIFDGPSDPETLMDLSGTMYSIQPSSESSEVAHVKSGVQWGRSFQAMAYS